jgi:hypothetical protein
LPQAPELAHSTYQHETPLLESPEHLQNFPNHANANANTNTNANANANATQIHNNPQCQSEQPAAKQEQTDCDTQNYKT